ncbi:hypothetical protein V6N11_001715 [Hibiscus sabdariffa]|uniref:Uncharacterized protein n=1 Tax=Hibiscus sabdariffa TaxID=183260 RepID=A0ABR2NRC7_9ROSI
MALHAPCMLHVNGSGNAYRRDSLDAEIPCNACSAAHLVPASVPQPPDNTTMDCPKDWSPWRSEREPTIHVVGSSNSRNPWEQPIYTYPTAGGTSYQHTEVNSFGGSSSSYPSHDDKVYRPHFEYP